MVAEINGRVPFVISDNAFQYLALQRGRISEMVPNRSEWGRVYGASVYDDLISMAPALPPDLRPRAIGELPDMGQGGCLLDIGSGLGGIDVLLQRRYPNALIGLVDGTDDAPIMNKHSQTFSSRRVATEFLRANGVGAIDYHQPGHYPMWPDRSCRLILSLQAWCFHIAPSVYIDMVNKLLADDGVLIVDVRRNHQDWWQELQLVFVTKQILQSLPKYDRVALVRK